MKPIGRRIWIYDILQLYGAVPITGGSATGSFDLVSYLIADAFYFLFAGGQQLFLTNAQRPFESFNAPMAVLPDNGFTVNYVPTLITRGPVKNKVGMQVDDLDITVSDYDLTVGGRPILDAVHAGAFDDCEIRVYLCVLLPSGGALQARNLEAAPLMFRGRVSSIEVDYNGIKLKVRSQVERLNIRMPRLVYQPGCHHTLFDSRCTLVKSSFGSSSTVASGSTQTQINSAHAQAAGHFDLGTVEFTSGANSGARRSVKAYTPGVFTLSNPLPFAPAVSDAFTAFPGCDKRQSTCTTKFNNLANFRAFPYVPTPETAY
jgi:uncharacterized phage protein (TIGR02218 family)